MMNTHKLIGENIIKYTESKNINLLNNRRFIWGNVKPDCVLKYKLIKHYYDESIDLIIDKIQYLSSLSIEDVFCDKTIEKFSEELGVVCHFLCDYFCAPHYYRWECKSTSAVKQHMLYEKKLSKIAKTFRPSVLINPNVTCNNVEEFIKSMQQKYNGIVNQKNDLIFSYYVCINVVDIILNSVFSKEVNNKVI